MKHQEVLFNVTGQSLYLDVLEGRPSGAPAATVYLSLNDDDTVTEAATTGSCSVDSVNTTLSASSSAGANTLSVTSAAGIARGRQYLIVDASGAREWIDVLGVAGTTLTLRQPLSNDHASGAALVGTRITIGVDPTWVANKSKISDVIFSSLALRPEQAETWPAGTAGYRVHWSYVVDGVNCVGISFVDLVRYQGKQLASPLEVDRRFPGWLDRLGPDDRSDQGAGLIDEALQAVKLDALGDAQVLRRLRSVDVLTDLVKHKANVLAHEAQVLAGSDKLDALELARKLYQQRYDQLVREPKIPVDQYGGGASAQPKRLPVWRR